MNLEIYKKGQGRYARRTAYLLGAALILFGAYRFFATFNSVGKHVWVSDLPLLGDLTLYKVEAFVVFALGLLGMHLILNRAWLADLLIDTEQEMRKVSWPSKSEVWSATKVVVLVTFVVGLALYGFDFVLRQIIWNYII